MKKTYLLILCGLAAVSCSDWLETSPEDYFSSGNFWKTSEQVESYMQCLGNDMRSIVFNHSIRFGELGAGIYRTPVGTNGNSLADPTIVNHQLGADVPGVESWGGYYAALADVNLFIQKVEPTDFMATDKKHYLLAQAYAMRAFCYFDLYRMYGGVPLRLRADVAGDGQADVNQLYLGRSTASETMSQILADADSSLALFGNENGFNPYGMGEKCFWNKAAAQCLKAEILLWNAKVSIDDFQADDSGLDEARRLLEDVSANYKLSLQPTYALVFDADNKANSEIILAVRYRDGEATNSNGSWLYHMSSGNIHTQYFRDGRAFYDTLTLIDGYNQVYEYLPQMYLQYEGTSSLAALDHPVDTRADAIFLNSYDYDEGVLCLQGTMCRKNIGSLVNGQRRQTGDYVLYRLPWVYLTLAEIANYQSDYSKVATYINLVRQRAYGSHWDAAQHAYTAGDFAQNELAILSEKDKEFLQEGQRWFDLRRMLTEKGNEATHLMFVPQANPAGNGSGVLTADNAWRVLWPVSTTIHGNDPLVNQTTGYPAFN